MHTNPVLYVFCFKYRIYHPNSPSISYAAILALVQGIQKYK